MASRWRVWDMQFKDNLLPNGETVLKKEKYPEFKSTDQSSDRPVIPNSILAILATNSKNRIKEDVILVSDSVRGTEYSYTRDGELKLQSQDTSISMTDQTVSCTSLIGEDSLSNSSQVRHSSCPNLIFPQNRNCPKETLSMSGVGCKGKPQAMGRAQELKRRAIKAASNENDQRQKVVGRGRATFRKK